ncbi:MAG: hypothetical protein OEQ13_03595 [Acidobacteriota bacterium]|nr:hypothetical protein [Acidobacteriota bacterium]
MSENRDIGVSPRTVYHMRQELLRLLESERSGRPPGESILGDRRLEELAGEWQRKYRTMRPAAACKLVEVLARESGPEPARFGVFVLTSLRRRWAEELWPEIERWAETLDDALLLRLIARRVAAPVLQAFPGIVERMEGAAEPPGPRLSLLLAETARALHVTDPAAADRVDALACRE